jgi:hypothetical protein
MRIFKTGDMVVNECCKCGLRHIWMFKVVRGKFPQDDKTEMVIELYKPAKHIKNERQGNL